jgi:hypothetical protein
MENRFSNLHLVLSHIRFSSADLELAQTRSVEQFLSVYDWVAGEIRSS